MRLDSKLWVLDLHCNFLACVSQYCSVDLRQAGRCNRYRVDLREDITNLALHVVLVHNFHFVEWQLGTPILQHLQCVCILFRHHPLQSTDVLASLEVDSTAMRAEVLQPLSNFQMYLLPLISVEICAVFKPFQPIYVVEDRQSNDWKCNSRVSQSLCYASDISTSLRKNFINHHVANPCNRKFSEFF